MCLVLRADLLVGAPIDLRRFDTESVWFAEHCCLNDAAEASTMALVRSRCAPGAKGEWKMRKRVLGACRVTQYGGMWGLQYKKEDWYYFLMDWWLAARPSVVRSWLDINTHWERYKRRLQKLRIARWFSHYLWAIHVHDFLNATARVRFMPGVRVNLVRGSYLRLMKHHLGRPSALGEYVTDSVGNCETLVTAPSGGNRTISSEALLASRVPPQSVLGRFFAGRFAPMAEQCALARLPEPVICCGQPSHCGTHVCGASYDTIERNHRFWLAGQRGQQAVPNTKLPAPRVPATPSAKRGGAVGR